MPNSSPYVDARRARQNSAKFLALCELSRSEQARVERAAKIRKVRRLEQEFRDTSDALDVARRELRAA